MTHPNARAAAAAAAAGLRTRRRGARAAGGALLLLLPCASPALAQQRQQQQQQEQPPPKPQRPAGRPDTTTARWAATDALASALLPPAPLPPPRPPVAYAPVPFAVGEELTFKASFGGMRAGTARMRVEGVEVVRGRLAYHLVFSVDGGVPFFRVHDRYDSWIDVETLSSLRHRQDVSEGRYRRMTGYEIYPERSEYRKHGDSLFRASVPDPLDDGSFIYAVRVAGVRVGETRRDARYFRPDRNPVVLTGLRQDTVTVDAGTFATTVVRPTIRTTGIFSENGEAQVWFTNDARRYPVLVRTKFAKFSLTLALQSIKPGDSNARGRRLQRRRKSSRQFD